MEGGEGGLGQDGQRSRVAGKQVKGEKGKEKRGKVAGKITM